MLLLLAGRLPAAGDLTALDEQALKQAVRHVAPCVVTIETLGGLEQVGGLLVPEGPTTGLIVSPDGYIIASAFGFVQKPSSILVGLGDGTRVPATLVATDRSRMLVLLKVNVDEKLPTPELSPRGQWQVGRWAIAVGRTYGSREPSMSVGIVSALDRIWGKAVQTDAKISPANYGGPLVDVHGRVMGVLVPLSPDKTGEIAGVQWYDSGIGFAIPLEHVYSVLPRLKQGKDLDPGLAGLSLRSADLYADVPVIGSVRPNSPAFDAGLRRGDKIVGIDKQPVERAVDMMRHVQRHYAGERMSVEIVRGSERLTRELLLAAKIDPYRRPLLGIVPDHAAEQRGVVVGRVIPKSPAAKAGLEPGDRIIELSGAAVDDAEALAEQVSVLKLGTAVKVTLQRAGQKRVVEVRPVAKTDVPEPPAAADDANAAEAAASPAEIVELAVGEFKNKAALYVPAGYDQGRAFGLLVWLHGPGGLDAKQVAADWKTFCDAQGYLLLAPRSDDPTRWTSAEIELVKQAIETVGDSYHVDPLRIAAAGVRGGGTLAYVLACHDRDHVRGAACFYGRLPIAPPENEPDHRLDIYLVETKDAASASTIDALRKAGYPLTLRQTKDEKPLDAAARKALVRWLEILDRI